VHNAIESLRTILMQWTTFFFSLMHEIIAIQQQKGFILARENIRSPSNVAGNR